MLPRLTKQQVTKVGDRIRHRMHESQMTSQTLATMMTEDIGTEDMVITPFDIHSMLYRGQGLFQILLLYYLEKQGLIHLEEDLRHVQAIGGTEGHRD